MKPRIQHLLLVLLCGTSSLLNAHPGHDDEPGSLATTVQAYASQVTMSIEGEWRVFRSNGLPNHETGQFPNPGNPNTIRAQNYTYRIATRPTLKATSTPLQRMPFGIALNGVMLDPGTAEAWKRDPQSGWNIEAIGPGMNLGLDQNNAHVQPNGAYHYHAVPTGLVKSLGGNQGRMLLIGYAADGFPIYVQNGYQQANDPSSGVKRLTSSYRLKSGPRPGGNIGPGGTYDGTYVQDYEYVPGLGDLDESNGRTGVTPEYPEGTYYYVITDRFPYIPRSFRGTPSMDQQRSGRPPGGGPGPGGPPPFDRPPPRL